MPVSSPFLFPKHHESPIDGGKGELKNEPGSLLENIQQNKDVYELLANRRKSSGISLLKVDQMQIAKVERDKCKEDDARNQLTDKNL